MIRWSIKTLYCIPSPISADQFQQVSLESVELFEKISTFFVESIGPSQKLIKHFGIDPETKQWIELEKKMDKSDKKSDTFFQETLLESEETEFGLLCDVGTPGICDPGEDLLRICKQNEINIRYAGGPCSIIASLLTAGLCPNNFYFCGFVPQKVELREKALKELQYVRSTLVLMEAPHRLVPILESFSLVWGAKTKLTLCMDVTGPEQKIITDSVEALLEKFVEDRVKIPFIILIENKNSVKNPAKERKLPEERNFEQEERSLRDFEDRDPREFSEKSQDFGDRPPRRDFGNRPPRSFGDRPPRRDFGDRPPRSFGDRPPRRDFGGPPRSFGDRPPRRDFGGPPRSFGDRSPRRDFGGPPRSFGDRPPRRDFGGPPRSFGDRPPRRDFENGDPREFGDRPPRGEERSSTPFNQNTGPKYSFSNGAPKSDFSRRGGSSGEIQKKKGFPSSLFKPKRTLPKH